MTNTDHRDAEALSLALAESLATMTRRPGAATLQPGQSYGDMPMDVSTDAASGMQPYTGFGTRFPAPEVSGEEAGLVGFTPEMVQTLLGGGLNEDLSSLPGAQSSDYATSVNAFAGDVPLREAPLLNAPMPENVHEGDQPREDFQEPPTPGLLEGFDPAKYLAATGGYSPASATPPVPSPSAEPNHSDGDPAYREFTGSTAYDDIEQGAGAGGQKDSREVMQMLRELTVLKDSY